MKHLPASRMSAFYWNASEPSVFASDRAFVVKGPNGQSLSKNATARNGGLVDPMRSTPKGAISIAPRDRDTGAKTKRLRQARI